MSGGLAMGFGAGPSSPLDDLSPEIRAQILRALQTPQPGSPEVPDATFRGFQPATPPTGEPTPVVHGSFGGPAPEERRAPARPLLADALGGAPSMLGGQMPAPEMPAATEASARAPARIPSLLGLQPPEVPSGAPTGPASTAPAVTGSLSRPPARSPVPAPMPASDDDDPSPAAPGLSPRNIPLPPARPAEFGGEGMKPVDGFDPLTGQPVSGSPQRMPSGDFDPLTGQVVAGRPTPVAQPAAAQASPAQSAETGGPSKGMLSGLFGGNRDPGMSNALLAMSAGLLSGRTLGDGLGRGFQNILAADQAGSKADMERLEYGLKLQKARQEQGALSANARLIQQAFPGQFTDEQAVGSASNGALVSAAIARMQNKNAGRDIKADASGVQRYTDTGEQVFRGDEAKDGRTPIVVGGNKYWLKAGESPSEANIIGPAEADKDQWQLVDVPLDGGRTQKQWIRKGEASGTAVGQPSPPDKPQGFEVESKLRGEFAKGLGTFQDVHDGYGRVIAATRQREANPSGVSPASDIGLIFGYMKMLDPGSVVREGEYATAANAAGIPERVRNAYNKAMRGEFLTPEQRQDFVGQAGELYGTARKNAEAVAGRYRNLAGQYGVDPDRTAYLPDMPTAPTVGRDRMKPGAPGAGPGMPSGGEQRMPAAPSRMDLEAEARRRGLIR